MESWDSEAEWVPAMAGAVEGRVYRGTEELQAYFAELFDSFAEVRLEDREYRDLGNRVLMLFRLRVRGQESGAAIDQLGGIVYTLRFGKIVHARSFLTTAEALEAVGLSE